MHIVIHLVLRTFRKHTQSMEEDGERVKYGSVELVGGGVLFLAGYMSVYENI